MLTSVLLLALIGCREAETGIIADPDADGDSFASDADCNDGDPAIFPGAVEACDGTDNDCDGQLDETGAEGAVMYYADIDGDGYGNAGTTLAACAPPLGYVTAADDCDDRNPSVHPGAAEADCADPVDYNCDGSTGFADEDGDRFPACADCNDDASAVNPDAVEACDAIDNDCDGLSDERGSAGETIWYADSDGDGQGTPTSQRLGCEPPDGYVASSTDCNDSDDDVFAGAAETCDGLDNDCDGRVDSNTIDAKTWYGDADGDGHGGTGFTFRGCEPPAGFVASSDDCDDAAAKAYPGAGEECDGVDNDCDAQIDDGFDLDGDGATTCGSAKDCNDGDKAIFPGATETCDGIDNDCDTGVDETGAIGQKTWYVDYDGDGYGDDRITLQSCARPSGFAPTADDCDDIDADFNPGAAEGCDGGDYNCDGETDNDADADGYPDSACGGADCDDSDPNVLPEVGGGCALGIDCLDIKTSGLAQGDGLYSIDPDGFGAGKDPYNVYCDMTTAGGGWTLVAQMVANVGGDAAWGYNSNLWTSNSAVLNDNAPTLLGNVNAKYSTFNTLPGRQGRILIRDRETSRYSVLAVPGFVGVPLVDRFINMPRTNLGYIEGERSPQELMGYPAPTRMCFGAASKWMINQSSSHGGVRLGNDVASNDQVLDDQSSWTCYDSPANGNLAYSGVGGTLESNRAWQDGYGSESLNRWRSNGGTGQGSHNGAALFVK